MYDSTNNHLLIKAMDYLYNEESDSHANSSLYKGEMINLLFNLFSLIKSFEDHKLQEDVLLYKGGSVTSESLKQLNDTGLITQVLFTTPNLNIARDSATNAIYVISAPKGSYAMLLQNSNTSLGNQYILPLGKLDYLKYRVLDRKTKDVLMDYGSFEDAFKYTSDLEYLDKFIFEIKGVYSSANDDLKNRIALYFYNNNITVKDILHNIGPSDADFESIKAIAEDMLKITEEDHNQDRNQKAFEQKKGLDANSSNVLAKKQDSSNGTSDVLQNSKKEGDMRDVQVLNANEENSSKSNEGLSSKVIEVLKFSDSDEKRNSDTDQVKDVSKKHNLIHQIIQN